MNEKNQSVNRFEAPHTSGSWVKAVERVLVISDSQKMRERLIAILQREEFVVFDQPSAIGATRSIRINGIRAVVIDSAVPGFPAPKLIKLLRVNPRLDGMVVVVIAQSDENGESDAPGLESANAIISQSSVEVRLAPLLGRLLRNSSFRPSEDPPMAASKG